MFPTKFLPMALLFLLSPTFAARAEFVHPGLYHLASDLEFMRKKIEAQAEPWSSGWVKLQGEYYSKLTWSPTPNANWDANANAYMKGDAVAAYSHALQWALTGNQAHADKSIEILNAWSGTLETIQGKVSQEMLVSAWNASKLANAAELLVHYTPKGGSPSGWKKEDVERFRRMLGILSAAMGDFKPGFNGNWDATIMHSLLCIAVFNDDRTLFDRVIDHFHGRYHLPAPKNDYGHLKAYILPSGQCQESGRDQGHVQMGLGNYIALCEVAWKQGVDLYSAEDNLLLRGIEYTAKFMLGDDDVPFVELPPLPWKTISQQDRGVYAPIYEAAYQHYVHRKGLEMPFTARIIAHDSVLLVNRKTPGPYRPEPSSPNTGLCWGTLTVHKGPEDAKSGYR
jgi:hypothetical protein